MTKKRTPRPKSTKTTSEKLIALGGTDAARNEIDRLHKEGSERFGWSWYFANRTTSEVYHELEALYDNDHNTLLQYALVKTAWKFCESEEKDRARHAAVLTDIEAGKFAPDVTDDSIALAFDLSL